VRDGAFDVLTPEAAYWLGFIFADGHVATAPGRIPRVQVRLTAADEGHVLKFRAFLGSGHKVTRQGARRGPTGYLSKPACAVSIPSWRLCGRILELGRYEGTISPDLAGSADFWRGVVDGDGTVGTRTNSDPWIGLVGRRRILEGFRNFASLYGPAGRMTLYRSNHALQLVTTGRFAYPLIERLYGHGGPMLDRKAETARAFIDVFRHAAAAAAADAAELRARYEAGASIRQIACHYGVADPTILRRMKTAGIERRARSGGPVAGVPRHAIDLDAVYLAYEAGASLEEIASGLGVNASTIRHRARAAGVELRYHKVCKISTKDAA
jgi:transposase-like protein